MKKAISFILLLQVLFFNCTYASTYWQDDLIPFDKYEKFNRKIFNLNLKTNRVFIKNIHILWASLFPNFIIDSLNRLYTNIEYPKRLISCILQKDKKAAIHETKRFLINTTLGLAGLIDSAYKIFHLEEFDEDMEQALSKLKIKQGSYLVLPFVSSITPREILGRFFDFVFTPSTYISSPVAAAIKLGLLINRTAQIQPVVKVIESNFADPYDIVKKAYMINKVIKLKNYDRLDVLASVKFDDEIELVNKEDDLQVKGKLKNENLILNENNFELTPDIYLENYNPKSPLSDSMRTALFDVRNMENHFWAELAIWNRSFNKKLKTASIEVMENKPKYEFKYALQKNKQAPLAIIFPSIGEGVTSAHSANIAKLFFSEGYSVIILGSHFHWGFLKCMSENNYPGIIKNDLKYINAIVNGAINYLSKKYDRIFMQRTAFATSLGAYSILFLASEQMENCANNIDKFIAICPPIELGYSMDKIDEVMDSVKNSQNPDTLAIIGAKLARAYQNPKNIINNLDDIPISNYEAKFISAYIFHQKLSDLIFNIELNKNPNLDKKELYKTIDKSNFKDYREKYLCSCNSNIVNNDIASLKSVSNYLINKDNYKIFHSIDDYLVNKNQLKELKSYAGDKLVLFSNGAHLGFLYRDEFIEALKKEIKLKN